MKLDGVRVIDLSQFLPGPTVTQMMADHGADVIKIEALAGGEPTRVIGQRRGDQSVYFSTTQRGKRSLALNLKSAQGVEIFLALAASADVVLESFRPGVVKRLGIDYEAVSAVRNDVVYASISAFGQSGPLVANPAHDLAVEAMCGLLSANADAQGNPVIPAMPSGDMLAAGLTLSGILMALLRRAQTGSGDYLDVAMMDAIQANMPNSVGAVFGENRAPILRDERIWGGHAFYNIYATADERHVVLGGSETKFVSNLLTALGRPDLIDLCREPGPGQDPVRAFLADVFRRRSQSDWVEFFENLDVCFAPVNDLPTGFAMPQTIHREMVVVDEQGDKHLGIPLKFSREPGRVNPRAPAHGEHTDELLTELGYSEMQITQAHDNGVC